MIQLPIQTEVVKYILSDYIPYNEINEFGYIKDIQFNKYRMKIIPSYNKGGYVVTFIIDVVIVSIILITNNGSYIGISYNLYELYKQDGCLRLYCFNTKLAKTIHFKNVDRKLICF
jgi:hypothetical protein